MKISRYVKRESILVFHITYLHALYLVNRGHIFKIKLVSLAYCELIVCLIMQTIEEIYTLFPEIIDALFEKKFDQNVNKNYFKIRTKIVL